MYQVLILNFNGTEIGGSCIYQIIATESTKKQAHISAKLYCKQHRLKSYSIRKV